MQEVIRQTHLVTEQTLKARLFPNNEWVLLVVLLVECLIFSVTGSNFLTAGNAFEITRLSVEIGLLALVPRTATLEELFFRMTEGVPA